MGKHKDKDTADAAAMQVPDAAELLDRIKREQRARIILDRPAPWWHRLVGVPVMALAIGAMVMTGVAPVEAALGGLGLAWLLEETVMRRHLERRLDAALDLLKSVRPGAER